MPFLNRAFGNPLLSGLGRALFRNSISDFHCGMRAIRSDALPKLELRTPGMEFASEMVVKALRQDLRIAEIDIEYRERVGETKLNRWRDGWRHLRFLFRHAPDAVFHELRSGNGSRRGPTPTRFRSSQSRSTG